MKALASPPPRPSFFLFLFMLAAFSSLLSFDGERAKGIVDEIASDRYEGRKSGVEGGRMVEKYVASRFEDWGLEPAGESGGFFHPFPMLLTVERGSSLQMTGGPLGPVSFLCGDDYTMITNSGSGDVNGEVVIAGYGLSDEEREWNDYGEMDVKGKVVLIFRGKPENGYDWSEADARDSTLHEAVGRGAAAVLWNQRDRAIYGAAVHEGSYFPDVPTAYVAKRFVDHLFRGTGYDENRYRDELADGPLPFETGKRVRFQAELELVEGAEARNVVGRVAGADTALADEIIIVGGHMDHLGIDGEGRIYNGANDNASGTSVVMELARSFARGDDPARTIVFITFAGEEQGLLGSIAFAENPTFDLGGAVAMINFDMNGHGNGKVGIGGGEYYPEVWSAFRASLDSAETEGLRVGRSWSGGSDHLPFRHEGIPTFNVWSEGDHRFYHTVEDDPEWIDEEVLASVGGMAERWIRFLADWPEPLLSPHRVGRSLLYASVQVDFDGLLHGPPPGYVLGRVRWFDAGLFPQEPFLDGIGDLHLHADDGDSLSLIYDLGEVRTAARRGKRSALVGVMTGHERRVSARDIPLLGDLNVGFARWQGDLPGEEDREYLKQISGEGVAFLTTAEPAWREGLPESCKRYVRFFPGRGEKPDDPEAYPRKNALFVLALDGPPEIGSLLREIERLRWDRVHLDLVPWVASGGEEEIAAFLEELMESGGFRPGQMAGLLGENLNRL